MMLVPKNDFRIEPWYRGRRRVSKQYQCSLFDSRSLGYWGNKYRDDQIVTEIRIILAIRLALNLLEPSKSEWLQIEIYVLFLDKVSVIFSATLCVTNFSIALQISPFSLNILSLLLRSIIKIFKPKLIFGTISWMSTFLGWPLHLNKKSKLKHGFSADTLTIGLLRPETFNCPILDVIWHVTGLASIIQISANHFRPVHNESIVIKLIAKILLLISITISVSLSTIIWISCILTASIVVIVIIILSIKWPGWVRY